MKTPAKPSKQAKDQRNKGHAPTGYYASKPGPKAHLKPFPPVSCERCRNLTTVGKPACRQGRILDAVNCPDFKDASHDRIVLFGGISGVTGR